MFPHPDKYSWGISYEYLTGWPKPTEEEIITLCLCHTIFITFKVVCITNKKTVSIPASYSWYFFLGACFCSSFNCPSSKSSSRFKEFSLCCLVISSSLIRRKGKLSKTNTLCHSLSFVVSPCTTRCHLMYYLPVFL